MSLPARDGSAAGRDRSTVSVSAVGDSVFGRGRFGSGGANVREGIWLPGAVAGKCVAAGTAHSIPPKSHRRIEGQI